MAAAADAAARERRETYPELAQLPAPGSPSSPSRSAAGGATRGRSRAGGPFPGSDLASAPPCGHRWGASSPSRRRAASPRRCWSSRSSRRTRDCSPVHSLTSRSSPLLPRGEKMTSASCVFSCWNNFPPKCTMNRKTTMLCSR